MRILLFILFVFFTTSAALCDELSKDERKALDMNLKQLKKGDDSERYDAVERLRYYNHPDSLAALSFALTKDPSSSVRNMAALSLFEMKEDAKPAIPALQQALKDNDSFVRLNAGATLLNLDVDEQTVLAAIRPLLQHPEARSRVSAARFLRGNVPFAEILPVLAALLKDSDVEIRRDASKVFDDSKELPPDALPVLVQSLKDPDARVRENAADALDVYDSKGTPALPALIVALKDPDRDVRFEAVDTITEMGTWGKDALPQIAEVIRRDADAGVRRAALRALEWVDPEGRNSVPILLEALKDRDPEVRQMSLEVMAGTRPFPVHAVAPAKAALASETNERVKMYLQKIIERGEQEKSYGVRMKTDTGVIADTTPKTPGAAMPKEEAMRILQEKDIQMTTDSFWHSLNEGDAEVVKAMLSAGFPANTELQNSSALMMAIRNYNGDAAEREIIQSLLDFGADVNYKDENNTTPFFYAAEKCEIELLRTMMKAGAVLEVQAKGGATTLTQAAMANKVDTVRMLLKAGYKLKNEPTWLLSSTKNPEILAMLRKAGAK